jgi:hypothetical protein
MAQMPETIRFARWPRDVEVDWTVEAFQLKNRLLDCRIDPPVSMLFIPTLASGRIVGISETGPACF